MILISHFNQFILKLEQKSLEKGLGWIINSLIDHNISISKYNPLAGGSCIKLPKELNCVFGYENKQKHPIYIYKKSCEEKMLI